MPSRLSSLLVRDGLVGVKRMEHAFQRQVIYGGCLDTILLEMNLVPEERLLQYLSLATGLPPATRSEIEVTDTEAEAKCPIDAARAFRVVPLCFEEGALRVLVHDPVDMGLLEELANELESPVQPLVVPEYRFHLAFARTFGGTPNARFESLAKRAEENPPSSPVGRARSVIVEEGEARDEAGDEAGDQATSPFDEDAVTLPRAQSLGAEEAVGEAATRPVAMVEQDQEPHDDTPTVPGPAGSAAQGARAGRRAPPRETILGVGLPGAESFVPEGSSEPIELAPKKVITAPMGSRNAPSGTDRVIGADGDTTPAGAEPDRAEAAARMAEVAAESSARMAVAANASALPESAAYETTDPVAAPSPAPALGSGPARAGEPAGRQRADSLVGGDLVAESLEPAWARAELAVADDRDLIFGLLLRALRSRAWYAGLLTVQGGAAIGRIAIAGDEVERDDIGEVLIPLDMPSAFQTVAQSAAPHIGPIATGDAEIDSMILRMGEVLPPTALLLPVVLRSRVVAMVVAHNREEPVDAGAMAELFPLANLAADAILRLIAKAKAGGSAPAAAGQAATSAPASSAQGARGQAEPLPPPPEAGPDEAASDEAASDDDADDLAPEISIEADEPDPIDMVLDVLEGEDKELAAQARAEALRRVDETIEALAARFPGKLEVDRYEIGGRTLPAAQHGPLLALVVDLGEAATELITAKLRDSKREVRYYATLCVSELRPNAAVGALVERLFDTDYGTRTAAMSALSGYPTEVLDQGLVRARQALHSEDPERVQAAANALAYIADIRAIPDLLDANARGDKGSEHARRALVQLTKQNFGGSARKWRSWWNKHKKQHRIEWLIEGLAHKDENIRRTAAEDLRKLTGEYFGYEYDASKRDREGARQRWREWWKEIGSRRFAGADERHRATAVVPSKDD